MVKRIETVEVRPGIIEHREVSGCLTSDRKRSRGPATAAPIDLSMSALQLTVTFGTEMKTTKPFTHPTGITKFMRYSVSKHGVTFLFSDAPTELGSSECEEVFVEWED